MINLEDHLPKRKSISKIILKTQEVKLGDTPDGVTLESIQINEEPSPLEIGPEVLGETKADKMINHDLTEEEGN